MIGIGFSLTFDAQKDILENGLNAENITNTILGAITAGAGAYLVARKFGASPGLALMIALTVTLSLMAINFLTPIAEKAQKFVLEKFGNYGKAAGRMYADEMNKSIEINGTKVPITVSEVLMKTNGAVNENLTEMQNTVDSSTRNMFDSFDLSFKNIHTVMESGTTAAEQYFSRISDSADKNFTDTRFNIEGSITGAEKTFTTSIAGIEKNMNSAETLISNNSKTIADDLKTNLADGSMGLETLSKDSKTYSDEVKKNLSSISDAKVKTPKFSWSLATKAVGNVAKVLAALSMPTLLPTLSVSWYADGGFPDKGDLFIANEREPELIGTMGNKTTVANSMQIIEGIASASYSGMKRALQEVDIGGGDTLVYVGNKQLTDVVTKQQRFNDKKYGR